MTTGHWHRQQGAQPKTATRRRTGRSSGASEGRGLRIRGSGVMQTVIELIRQAGGWRPDLYLRLVNPPYIPLVIEALDESGPLGLPAISVAHYSEICGDCMRHPEMRFELKVVAGRTIALTPFYWRNDFVAAEQSSRFITENRYTYLPATYVRHLRFAKLWDDTLRTQGLVEAFRRQ